VNVRYRPKADLSRGDVMLRCGPPEGTFAASAR
jgi:hypothetical protein